MFSQLLFSDNDLEIIREIQSEEPNDRFGSQVIILDFNGDGYDDLAVNAPYRVLEEGVNHHFGKILIYYGNVGGLSDLPDLEVYEEYDSTYAKQHFGIEIQNLGDMNNDGYDDLGFEYYRSVSFGDSETFVQILLGNNINNSTPDYSYLLEYGTLEIEPLGDINGDGYDDIGLTDFFEIINYSIVYGNSFERISFAENLPTRNHRSFKALGDINNDGYDDFSYYFGGEYIELPDSTYKYNHKNRIFLGSTIQDTTPDFELEIMLHGQQGNLVSIGDWNNDGYDDFAIAAYEVIDGSGGCRFWLGGETINFENYSHIYHFGVLSPDLGDINNDGLIDLVDSRYSTGGGYLYFYLGNQNALPDYYIHHTPTGFGNADAVGDFNNDGIDDIVIGAKGDISSSFPTNFGKVYIFGGSYYHTEQDPDVQSNNNPIEQQNIRFKAYPNPFNPSINFEIDCEDRSNLSLKIFNVKGQLVHSILVNDNTLNNISWVPNKELASNFYLCGLYSSNQLVASKKVTLLK